MLLTVIIVTKNPGVDIYPTLASLKCLDGPGTEILIKDNSSDRSIERINEMFGFQNLRYIHSADKGIYDAMNQALGEAKGEFIYFLNAGDQHVDCSLMHHLTQSPSKFDYLYGDVIKLEPASTIQRYSQRMNKYLVYLKRICHQAIVIKKSVLEEAGGFDTSLTVTADHLLILQTVEQFKGFKIPGVLSIYQGGGFSHERPVTDTEHLHFQREVSKHYSAMELAILNPLRSIIDKLAAIKRNRLKKRNRL